jgi:hypothetical protein
MGSLRKKTETVRSRKRAQRDANRIKKLLKGKKK